MKRTLLLISFLFVTACTQINLPQNSETNQRATSSFKTWTQTPPTTTPSPTIHPAVDKASDILNDISIVYSDSFHNQSTSTGWELFTGTIENDVLAVYGNNWNGLFRKSTISDGMGVVIDFTYTEDSLFEIFIHEGEWDTDDYKRFGFYIDNGQLSTNIWFGNEKLDDETIGENITLKSNNIYSVLLASLQDGDFIISIWDISNDTNSVFFRKYMGADWSNHVWNFGIGADNGYIEFDNYLEFAFESSAMPTVTPTPTPTLSLPVSLQTPIPEAKELITFENIHSLRPLAQWGEGRIYQVGFSPDATKIWAVTTTGLRVYDSNSLEKEIQINLDIVDVRNTRWAISPDFKYFAVRNPNRSVSIWNINEEKRIVLHKDLLGGRYVSMTFSPDSRVLAVFNSTSQYSGFTYLLRISNGNVILDLDGVGNGFFTAGNDLIVYGQDNTGWEREVSLYSFPLYDYSGGFNLEGGFRIAQTRRGSGSIWNRPSFWTEKIDSVELSPSGDLIAIGDHYNVRLYDVDTRELVHTYPSGSPKFSSDGNLISVCIDSYNCQVYNRETRKKLPVPGNRDDLIISPDGTRMAGVDVTITPMYYGRYIEQGWMELRDLEQGVRIKKFPGYLISEFSPDGRYLLLRSHTNAEYQPTLVINSGNGETMLELEGTEGTQFSPDSQYLAVVSPNGTNLIDVESESIITAVTGSWPQFHPDSLSFYTLSPGHIYRWSTGDGSLLAENEFVSEPSAILLGQDGSTIYEESSSGVREINLSVMEVTRIFPPNVIMSPTGEHYAQCEFGQIDIYQADNGKLIYSLPYDPLRLVFSPDGNSFAIATDRGQVFIYETHSGTLTQKYTIDNERIESANLGFSPDARFLYIHAEEKSSTHPYKLTVDVWDLDRERSWYSTIATGGWFTGMTISSDSQYLAYNNHEDHTQIMNLASWEKTMLIEDGGNYLAFSADGNILAIARWTGVTSFYDVASGELLYTLNGSLKDYTQWGISLDFSPDNQYFIRSADGVSTLWDINPNPEARDAILGNENEIDMVEYMIHDLPSEEGDFILIDNSDSENWYGQDSDPISLTQPFIINLKMDSTEDASLSLSGRINQPGKEWWDGVHRLYLRQYQDNTLVIEVRDGRTEDSTVYLFVDGIKRHESFSIKFLDPYGKGFQILDHQGEVVAEFDVSDPNSFDFNSIHLPDGIFPEKQFYPGVLIGPGGLMQVYEFDLLEIE